MKQNQTTECVRQQSRTPTVPHSRRQHPAFTLALADSPTRGARGARGGHGARGHGARVRKHTAAARAAGARDGGARRDGTPTRRDSERCARRFRRRVRDDGVARRRRRARATGRSVRGSAVATGGRAVPGGVRSGTDARGGCEARERHGDVRDGELGLGERLLRKVRLLRKG